MLYLGYNLIEEILEDVKLTNLEFKLKLLELEVQALRSVLSEYEKDHTNYLQFILAENIRAVLDGLK